MAFVYLGVGALPAQGQTAATVTGTIVDPSGGALPSVSLTLRHAATGLLRTSVTSTEGRFAFAGVPVGEYELSAELSGFRRLVRQGLIVTVGETVSLPLAMEVGGVEQTVTVSGGAPLVNTVTSELSFLVSEQAIASSIREFRVESNAYSAEFGRNFGGQINVLTKSGSNTMHGSAYEFHRNDALDARNYFDVAGKPPFTRNQFGGSLGGPLRQDRLFYFVGYEG